MLNRIFSLLDAQWLIHRETAVSYLPVLISFLNGQKVILEEGPGIKPYALSKKVQDDINLTEPYALDNPDLPENSVAVIPIDGVLVSWKTMEIVRNIRLANDNPKICAVVLLVNSPGGMVFYTDITANAIKALQKPSVSVIFNMAASAAMWLISSSGYRIATSQMDRIGSIGVKTSFMDLSGFLKDKLGISVYEIYATLSSKKDEQIRELLKDPSNPQPIIDELDATNLIFHKTIMDNLGIKEDSEVFAGGIFTASKAIDLGLINEINTMEYAIQYAYSLGLANIIKSNFQFTH